MSAAIWTGFGLSVLSLGLTGALIRTVQQEREHRRRLAALEHELDGVCTLAGLVSSSNWQTSMENLVNFLVRDRVCDCAMLYTLTENGYLELWAQDAGDRVRAWDPLANPELTAAMQSRIPVQSEEGALYLPIMEEGDMVGLLALRSVTIRMGALEVAVKLASLGLMGLKRHQKQVTLSNTDGLTGLATHRHFQQVLGVALGKAYLEGSPLSVILLDIDHFKGVNDTYGHLLGDLVLREIAYLLRRGLPTGAIAARYGGEEIVIVLQGDSANRADEIAEQLRAMVAGHEFYDFASGTRLTVTVSLGVAAYELGQGKNRLIGRVDEALYTSKREGRNRVTVAFHESSTTEPVPS